MNLLKPSLWMQENLPFEMRNLVSLITETSKYVSETNYEGTFVHQWFNSEEFCLRVSFLPQGQEFGRVNPSRWVLCFEKNREENRLFYGTFANYELEKGLFAVQPFYEYNGTVSNFIFARHLFFLGVPFPQISFNFSLTAHEELELISQKKEFFKDYETSP